MPDRKPFHPAVNEALRIGLGAVARASAHFIDSFLKDVGDAFRTGERKVNKARSHINRKVVESEIDYEPQEDE